ncbi:hypothetical protein ANCCAN_22545, partial [Ancylostoma caninum]
FFSPAPKPTWYHNGHEISEDTAEGFRFEAYGKTLVFNVTQDKAGKYDCRFPVHNDIDRTFNVIVEGRVFAFVFFFAHFSSYWFFVQRS